MPSLVGTTVAANYLKSTANFSQFGTRELAFISITVAGVHTSATDANSLFSKTVRALQQTVEVYFVGTPATNAFVAIIAADTSFNYDSASAGVGSGTGWGLLETAIAAGNGGVTATVATLAASGASIA
jgi:hypothetical protein